MVSLNCCVEVPHSYFNKARYGLEMLLFPLGIKPVWGDREKLEEGGFYYGLNPDEAPANAVRCRLTEATVAFFEERQAFDFEGIQWVRENETELPVLFDGGIEGDGDLIASAFFWLSGWQELLIKQRDQHGRFTYAGSLQEQLESAYLPAVDAYRERLGRSLEAAGLSFVSRPIREYSWFFCPTHDIDYLRKWRPGMVYRETVEYFISNSQNIPFDKRLKRFGAFLFDFIKPRDVFRKAFAMMIEKVHKAGGRATYFIKTGAHGPNDVYYRTTHHFLKKMVRSLDKLGFEVGLHPSYHAHDHIGYVREEKKLLQSICLRRIRSVRQHFLRYDRRTTSAMHEKAGFYIDSTLAFPDHEGFRNATCHPFRVYDIERDKALDVWEVPLCVMDGTVFNRRNLSVEEAVAVTRTLMTTCQKYGGVFVGLWHNTLWDELDFPGWGAHFDQTLRIAKEEEAHITTLRGALSAYGLSAG